MKAVVFRKYGSPNELKVEELEKPQPTASEVLIKLKATSINAWDWEMLSGEPKIYRLLHGLFKPRFNILGADIAGTIEAIGENCSQFKVGDDVMSDICHCWGGFAEYVCVEEKYLTQKPANMSFTNAAAIPQAGVIAHQAVNEVRKVSKGEHVLINGAGGCVGTFAAQLAKHYGAEVTCVDSEEKRELCLSLGADNFIDYKTTDFTRNGIQYDLIIEAVSRRSISDYKRALKPNGIYKIIGGDISSIFGALIKGSILNALGKQKFLILAHKPNAFVNELNALYEQGAFKPAIDSILPLEEAAAGIEKIATGKAKGKVVIEIA